MIFFVCCLATGWLACKQKRAASPPARDRATAKVTYVYPAAIGRHGYRQPGYRVNFWPAGASHPITVDAHLQQPYQPGDTLTIYYDPKQIHQSVTDY